MEIFGKKQKLGNLKEKNKEPTGEFFKKGNKIYNRKKKIM
jgi:hypothetical protein